MVSNRHRYLLVRFLAKSPIPAEDFKEAVEHSVKECYGKFGSAEMKTRVIGFGPECNEAMIRCQADSVEKLRAALAMISRINGQAAAAMVVRSSGTIKGLGVQIQRTQR